MLSIVMSSRVRNNPDSNMPQLLDSAARCVAPEDYDKIEFLVKYDFDDDLRPGDDFFRKYPFAVKPFVYERGEGRHYNHHFSEYMFCQRNPAFKWVMSMADDFYFTRPGFLDDLKAITDEYMVVGYTRPNFEINGVRKVYDSGFPYNFDHLNGIGAYCPCLTANIVEIAQNMGWQSNIDAWIVLLEAKLYEHYGILLWKQIADFYHRGGGYGLGDTPTRKNWDIYNNMTITGARIPHNKYLFKLMDQQAKNVYLNIVYGNRQPDAEAVAKLDEIKRITPVFDPATQEPPPGWVHWDAPIHNKPPIFEWGQIG